MLHPDQFEVNETWIAFRLNRKPMDIARHGEHNCIALMDAASCYILCSEVIPARAEGLTQLEAHRLLRSAENHKQQLPKSLYISNRMAAGVLEDEAAKMKITVSRIADNQLRVFIREARDCFEEYLDSIH